MVSFIVKFQTGKPHKEMVVIQFTSKAICNVTDTPFFFVSIDDIEHIHFERIMAGAKNFDMVILLKVRRSLK